MSGSNQSEVDSMLFSGGINGAIHLWRIPDPREVEPYGPVLEEQ